MLTSKQKVRRSDVPQLFSGASDNRITPNLADLRKKFASVINREEAESISEPVLKKPRTGDMVNSRPVEKSAKKRPEAMSSSAALSDLIKKHRPPNTRKSVDPRFSDMYGAFNKNHYRESYKFITEQAEEEQQKRLDRLTKLRAAIRHYELEAAGEDLEEYGLEADERELFKDDMEELDRLLHTPLADLQAEFDSVKKLVNKFKSQAAQEASTKRDAEARRSIMKAEVDAVKAGEKSKPFIPRGKEMRRKIEELKFEYLEEKGGANQANKYIEKKRKKKINIR
eukprot:Tbor_TRINITY_DN5983_c0_g1::TRINITY_DN5983_c0_g1_i1::g.18645::m.18645